MLRIPESNSYRMKTLPAATTQVRKQDIPPTCYTASMKKDNEHKVHDVQKKVPILKAHEVRDKFTDKEFEVFAKDIRDRFLPAFKKLAKE